MSIHRILIRARLRAFVLSLLPAMLLGPAAVSAAAPANSGAPQPSSIGGALGQIGSGLSNTYASASGRYLAPTPGTTSSEAYLTVQGLPRRYILIRPTTLTQGAPMLVLMHALTMTPETMANLTRAGRLAAQYGVWVYLPEAELSKWNDDPSIPFGADDVGFIRQLIDTSVASNKLDAKRVFLAGYSAGGFMAERAACALSSRVAGIATVAATLRDTVAASCRPVHPLPITQFQGTSDIVVPYNGEPSLSSAPVAAAFWARQSTCSGAALDNSLLPNVNRGDGTTVSLRRYSGCAAGSEVRLYTVDGGGHTWPGALTGLYTVEFGRTSLDVDATLEIWRFLSAHSLP